MVKRLEEQYQVDDVVEIKRRDGAWVTAVVVSHQHPGIWVQTVRREHWFVTNTGHIRLRITKQAEE